MSDSDTVSADNPWRNGHSIDVLRSVSASITPNVDSFTATPVDMDGVAGEIIHADTVTTPTCSVLYLHGGAYLCGNPEQYRNITAGLAQAASAEVVAVDYRLAPEHGHPAAFTDASTAYAWLNRQRPDAALVIAGDSAGAAIAVATALQAQDTGCRKPVAVLCNSPFADLTLSSASLDDPLRNQGEPNRATIEWLVRTVIDASGGALHAADHRVSPVYADLNGLPPLLIQTGGLDNLEDDGVRLAQRADECGIDVVLTRYPQSPHIWPVFTSAAQDPQAAAALSEMADFIRRYR